MRKTQDDINPYIPSPPNYADTEVFFAREQQRKENRIKQLKSEIINSIRYTIAQKWQKKMLQLNDGQINTLLEWIQTNNQEQQKAFPIVSDEETDTALETYDTLIQDSNVQYTLNFLTEFKHSKSEIEQVLEQLRLIRQTFFSKAKKEIHGIHILEVEKAMTILGRTIFQEESLAQEANERMMAQERIEKILENYNVERL